MSPTNYGLDIAARRFDFYCTKCDTKIISLPPEDVPKSTREDAVDIIKMMETDSLDAKWKERTGG